ncbi:terminase large subunit [Romboutsia ilealis]|uniref:terminase large subunit n=1 Tax=Romboutsia ilealis TaxID=1115758 RepID=UPI0025741CBA|nr:terminase TerL endonuclease subunit [Romboutsia ilealis]
MLFNSKIEEHIYYSNTFKGNSIKEDLIEYCNRILDGRIIACKKHKWTCERFLNDLDKSNKNLEEFPYRFDELEAQRAIDWIEEFKHSKGELAGTRIKAHIFVKFILANVYGWININTGYRRFKRMYEQVGRKNAKSQTLAGITTYELAPYGVLGSEVYCLAPVSKQAKAVFKEAINMINGHRIIKRKFHIRESTNEIFHKKSNSTMSLFTKDDLKKGDSYNPQLAVIDEYHLFDTSEAVDVMESGMGARYNPLIAIITTAGRKIFCPCKEEYDYCSKIINPNVPINDDRYFVVIAEIDDKDDPFDFINLCKANPVVSTYKTGLESLQEKLNTAKERADKRIEYLTKQCNRWINQKINDPYMDMDKWSKCEIDEIPDIEGLKCVIGLDKSDKIDLTSITYEIDLGNNEILIMNHCFIPEETLEAKMKTDKVPYDSWSKQGYITVIPGAKIKNDYIVEKIKEDLKKYKFELDSVAYDPWHCEDIVESLEDEGILCIEVPQTYASLSEPTKDFRAKVYAKEVKYVKNPVLTYCMSNAVEDKDRKENLKLWKEKKSSERIDAAVTCIISHVRMMDQLNSNINNHVLSEGWSL